MDTIESAILLTGMTCCGKSTLADIIVSQTDFKKVSFGGFLFNYAQERGLETKKENLQIIGQHFLDQDPKLFLNDVLNYNNPGKLVIFEGVRHLSIFEEIKKLSKNTYSFFIDVPFDERLRRFNEREMEGLSKTNFLSLDNHKVESEIPLLKKLSDGILDGTADRRQLTKFILQKVLP